MEFDDARVALRRHIDMEGKNVEISSSLFDLGLLIRDHKIEEIKDAFSNIVQVMQE